MIRISTPGVNSIIRALVNKLYSFSFNRNLLYHLKNKLIIKYNLAKSNFVNFILHLSDILYNYLSLIIIHFKKKLSSCLYRK